MTTALYQTEQIKLLEQHRALMLDVDKLLALHLPARSWDAHKGDFGHALVIGGNYGMAGAARLAGEAAARIGAGLVTVATRPENVLAINAARPELLCYGVANPDDFEKLCAHKNAVVIGPGLGQDAWARELFLQSLACSLPLLIDADALNLLASDEEIKSAFAVRRARIGDQHILTPHPGEAARLLGIAASEVQADRFVALTNLQAKFGGVCVLKGAGTLIGGHVDIPIEGRFSGLTQIEPSSLGNRLGGEERAPGAYPYIREERERQSQQRRNPNCDGSIAVCGHGNPGMASGGMGDVLSGVIVGLIAQGLELPIAARLGVGLHALAGDAAAHENGERGLLALDLLDYLRRIINARN